MDHYRLALSALEALPLVADWRALRQTLRRAFVKRDRNWLLPVIGCEAVGGPPALALPAVAAVACAQLSIILVDDLLDADPRGEYRRIGPGPAANLAVGLMAAGIAALEAQAAPAETGLAATRALAAMLGRTALGQHLDVQNPVDEAGYWRVVATKSAPFFGTALELGALLGGAGSDTAAAVGRLGQMAGEIVQIFDDLQDALQTPANSDWPRGRSSLPLLFARHVDHPERERFEALCRALATPGDDQAALAEAQAILVRSGAVSYCVYQIQERSQAARAYLDALVLERPAGLYRLLDEQVRPVHELLAAMAGGDAVRSMAWAG